MKQSVFFDIDTQREFMHKRGRMYVPDAEDIIPNLERITKFAKKNMIRIVASMDNLRKREEKQSRAPVSYTKSNARKKIKQTMTIKFSRVPDKILDSGRIKRLEGKNIIIEKDQYSLFSNPNLKKMLDNIRKAYVYGVATDFCVKETVLDLLKRGIEAYMVKDAIKPFSKDNERKELGLLRQKGAKFLTTKQLLGLKFG